MNTNRTELTTKVYMALADIMFETGASHQDMDDALNWFNRKFWEDEEDEE